jgi:sensor histidine kinase YesM
MNIGEEDLLFSIQNSKPEKKEKRINGKSGGIGLENIRKRLTLLYPGRHNLNISDDGEKYSVELSLQLKDTTYE